MPERGSAGALALIYWIGIRIGRGVGRILLYPITLYFFASAPRQRRASRTFLRQALGRAPTEWDVFRHMHCFAATVLDRAFLLSGQSDRFDVRVHGGELILEQAASHRGCILLGAHLGSFEVLRVMGTDGPGLRLKVLMDVEHNSSITRFFHTLNPEIADTVLAVRGPESLLEVNEKLEEGYLIGTLGDRVMGRGKSVRCRFLGTDASFPTSPFQLAATMQCPIILMFGLYRGGNRYDLYFERLAERITAAARRRPDCFQAWAQRYARRLEHYVREAPFNWFNFYDFWAEDQTVAGEGDTPR